MITKDDLKCYRTNYEKSGGWITYGYGIILPSGILDAIEALCCEVERLRGWKKK